MIVRNCPANEDLYEFTDDYDIWDNPIMVLDTPNYCCKYRKTCDKINDCIIKGIIKNGYNENEFEIIE